MRNVARLIKIRLNDLPEKAKWAFLAFDEIHLQQTMDYDKSKDSILGPCSAANTMFVRGIFSNYKVPIWYKFEQREDKDHKLNKVELESIVSCLFKDAGVIVKVHCIFAFWLVGLSH